MEMTTAPTIPTAAPPVAVGPCAVARPLHQQPAAPVDSFAQAVHTLGAVDRQIAQVVVALMQQMHEGILSDETGGVGLEALLGLHTSWTRADRRMLVTAADRLRALPVTAVHFVEGRLSWGQIRRIVLASSSLGGDGLAELDAVIDRELVERPGQDPDVLVNVVDVAVDRLRADLAEQRETRRIESDVLWAQPALGGHGGTLWGQFSETSFATILNTLDAYADPPHKDETAGLPSDSDLDDTDDDAVVVVPSGQGRAVQRGTGLVRLCETAPDPNRQDTPVRRIPGIAVLVDAERCSRGVAGILDAPAAGAAPTLTGRLVEQLACDATIIPILTRGGVPVAVGTGMSSVTDKARTAVIARDGGCRFAGCTAPAGWCDVHHVRYQTPEVRTHDTANLVLLCRRHHNAIHHHGWTLDLQPDGTLTGRHRRWGTFTTRPRAQLNGTLPARDPTRGPPRAGPG